MPTKKHFIAATAAGFLALGVAGTATLAEAADEKEKCYGVVKAGKNDCGSKANNHSCQGHATTDNDPNEWLLVPKGLCERLGGGALAPKDAS